MGTHLTPGAYTVPTQTPNQQVKITKLKVDHFVCPASGQRFLRDTALKGFALRATGGGAKTFIVEKRIAGKNRRMTLGRYGALTVEQARREAQKLLGQIAAGVNPVAEKEQARLRGATIGDAYADFLEARKNLKPRTLYDYQRVMTVAFPDWQRKALRDISKDMVARRHAKLGETRGHAYANLSMRFLRALFNFAQAQYEDSFGHALIVENPVSRLTQTRAWYRVARRQTVIKEHQLPAWYAAVIALKEDGVSPQAATVADYLLFLLFTGLRRGEAAELTWSAVDLEARTVTITNTKNHEPLTLPLSDFLYDLLASRKAQAAGEHVFPGEGKARYLVEPRRPMARVIEASGVPFTLHDLRRTFITIAERLDISAYAIKRLVNHKIGNDVTAGYIVSGVERLRRPMQGISDYLVSASNARQEAKVVPLRNKPHAG